MRLVVVLLSLVAVRTTAMLIRCACDVPVTITLSKRTCLSDEPVPDTLTMFPNPDGSMDLLSDVLDFCLDTRLIGFCAAPVYAEACRLCADGRASRGLPPLPKPHPIPPFTPKNYFASYMPLLNDKPYLDMLSLAIDAVVRSTGARTGVSLDIGSGFVSTRASDSGLTNLWVSMPYGAPLKFLLQQSLVDNIHNPTVVSFVEQHEMANVPDGGVDVIVWDALIVSAVFDAQLTALAQFTSSKLAPAGRVVPAGGRLWVQLVYSDHLDKRSEVTTACGFNVSAFNSLRGQSRQHYEYGHKDVLALSDPVAVMDVNFATLHTLFGQSTSTTTDFTITESSFPVNGLVWWLDFHLDDIPGNNARFVVDTGPDSANLHSQHLQASLEVIHPGLSVRHSDTVAVTATFRVSSSTLPDADLSPFTFRARALESEAVSPSGDPDPAGDELSALKIPDWHFTMVNDVPRNEAYERGLQAVVTASSRVLDIGSGSGLLAMIAAREGAQQVTTVEMDPLIASAAKSVIAANGLDSRITAHNTISTDMTVDEHLGGHPADVLVFEIHSSDLFEEGLYATLNDALDRLTAPGVKVVPSATTMYAMPISSPSFRARGFAPPHTPPSSVWYASRRPAFNFTSISRLNNGVVSVGAWLHENPYTPLGPVQKVFTWDLTRKLEPWTRIQWNVTATAGGPVDGIAYWWDMDFPGGGRHSMDPTLKRDSLSYHWTQCVYLEEHPVDVEVGDTLGMVMAFSLGKTAFNVTGVW